MNRGKRALALILAAATILTSNAFFTVSATSLNTDSTAATSDAAAGKGQEGVPGGISEQGESSDVSGSSSVSQNIEGQGTGESADAGTGDNNISDTGKEGTGDNHTVNADTAGNALTSAPSAYADEEKTFELGATVSTEAPVLSGLGFTYYINYTVPPMTDTTKKYASGQLTIELPAHVNVKEKETGALSISGQDVENSYITPLGDGKKMLFIDFVSPLAAGTAKNISIDLTTDNFEIENDTKIKLSPKLTATADGAKVTGEIPEAKKPEVTIKADDGWNIEKSVGETQEKDGYYLVPYTIKAVNQKDGADADSNRYGRLNLESFSITDLLPSMTEGKKNSDGKFTGYPQGGGAEEVVSVTMGSNNKEVPYTTDLYSDGSVKSITFDDFEKSEDSAQNIGADKPVTTTYNVVVKYPKDPYVTPSDEKDLKEYFLRNEASLTYKLLGQSEATVKDTADVTLGEKEKPGTAYDLTIEKLGIIGGNSFNITEAGGSARFALYKDAECKELANDITGQTAAGAEQTTDEGTGKLTFKNLRSGTYYLKETGTSSGWAEMSPNPLKVTVGNTVAITDESSAKVTEGNVLQISNTTTELGIVEFYKYGKNAEGTIEKLEGAVFELKNENNGKTYEAVSDENGLVRFFGIPEGSYTLKETKVEDKEYTVSDKEITGIQVTGGQVTVPAGLDTVTYEGADTEGFLNISAKGILKIKKVSSKDSNISLAGAEFEIYAGTAAGKDDKPVGTLVTGEGGTAISEPLKAGEYVLKEIKAPGGYAVSPNQEYTSVVVTANEVTQTPYEIENDPMIPFTIHKQGVVKLFGSDQTAYTEELPGAEFTIYDSKGSKAGTMTTSPDQTGKAVSEVLNLAPGKYYYEETKTPEGYTPIGRTEFTLPLTEDTGETGKDGYSQLLITNYAHYGQLKILKLDSMNPNITLAGAKFSIYSDEACTKLVDTVTTDADGTAYSRLLPVGEGGTDYWIKETKSPEGYLPSVDKIKVTAETGQKEITVLNPQLTSIQITKTDSVTKEPMKGVKYGLYTKNADGSFAPVTEEDSIKQVTAITDKNGICTFKGLRPDTDYYVKELKTSGDYVLDETMQGPVHTADTWSSNVNETASVSYTNDRKAKLLVNKTTTMDTEDIAGLAMAGVEFTLYKYDENAGDNRGEKAGAAKTELLADGTAAQAVFDNLAPGKYVLVETKLPENEAGGYGKPSYSQVVEVKAGDNQESIGGTGNYAENIVTVKNEAVNGKLRIEKIGEEAGGENPENITATFQLYEDRGLKTAAKDTSGNEVVLTCTPDKIAESGWIAPGTYYLKEITVDSDYTMLPDPVTVVIEAGKTTEKTGDEAVVNYKKGTVNLKKRAAFQIKDAAGEKQYYDLKGSAFVLIKKSADNSTITEDVTKEAFAVALKNTGTNIDLSNRSSGMSGMLDAGEYWIVEYKSPKGYTMDAAQGTQVTGIQDDGASVHVWNIPCKIVSGRVSDTDDNTVNIDNTTEKGKLRLFKRGFQITGPLLDGARFEVYIVDDVNGEETEVDTPNGAKTVKLRKVNVSNSTDAGGEIMETGTAGSGSAVTVDIEPGTYYVKETKTPTGDWYWYHQWTGPIAVASGQESQETVLNYTMQGEGTKTNESGRPQAGAVFGVFETEADARKMAQYIEDNNISVYNANPNDITAEQKDVLENYKKDIKDKAFLNKNGIIQTAVSGGDGKIVFSGLVPGETYYILELLSPSGYEISGTAKTVIVNDDGAGFTEATVPAFQNFKLGRLKVIKYTTLKDKNYAVEGVGFKVYELKKSLGTPITDQSQYTDAELMAQGTSDKDGFYTSILLPAGDYIIFEDSVPDDGIVEKNSDPNATYRIIAIEQGKTNEENAVTETGKGFYNPAVKGKFIVKKTTVPVKGSNNDVKFQLEKKTNKTSEPEKWEKVSTFAVKANGKQYESDFLDEGTYRIYETTASGLTMAYTKDNPLVFAIEGGRVTGCTIEGAVFTGDKETTTGVPSSDAGLNQPMVIENQRQGSLKVQKKGAFGTAGDLSDEAALNAVTFALYRKVTADAEADCKDSKNHVSNITTQMENGQSFASRNNLDAGFYWLKEVSLTNPDYSMDTAIREVEIKSGEKNTVYTGDNSIINYTRYGKLQIQKTDANDPAKALSATYNIYTDAEGTLQAKDINGREASIITDAAAGTGLSGLLKAGTYYLKEAKSPGGYELDDTVYGPYEVVSNTITDISGKPYSTIFTDKKLFEIKVVKTDTKTAEPLKGAVIGLYSSEKCEEKDLVESAVTGDNGVVLFDNLTVGTDGTRTYYVKEIKAPKGYDLNEKIFTVVMKYSDYKASGKVSYEVLMGNDQLGKIDLLKKGDWQNIDESSKAQIPLQGAEFKVYRVSGNKVKHESNAIAADTIVTGSTGRALTKGLDAGWYEIVESKAPDGYSLNEQSLWAEVKNNEINDTYVTSPIINNPDKGRFVIEKYDGMEEQSGLTLIGNHRAAEFKLQRKENGRWADLPGDDIKVSDGKYTSNTMEPGEYRLIETVAPIHTYVKDGRSYAVEFQLDETPVEFTVSAGQTVGVNQTGGRINNPAVYNSPLGSIKLTKNGDQNQNEKLSGAAFELYTDEACAKKVEGSLKLTGTEGTILWEGLKTGDYWVKEVSTESSDQMLDDKGYAINDSPEKVTIAAGQLLEAEHTVNITVTNKADKGKLLIIKEDEANQNRLSGAVFDIYERDSDGNWKTKPADTVTVSENGGYSKLLPAKYGGTEYKVVETKAPSGYTLDSTLSKLEKVVTVYPLHQPAAGKNDDKNIVTFKNRRLDAIGSFHSGIEKKVRKAGGDWSDSVEADKSLLEDECTVDFLVNGYADGKNDIGASKFTVTDNQIVMQKRTDAGGSAAPSYDTIEATDKDYRINFLSIQEAKNGDIGKSVSASVYIQKSQADKTDGTWYLYEEIADVSVRKDVSFSPDGKVILEGEKVIGVRVEYGGVDKGFTSNGMKLNVTFLNRSGWSGTSDNEVRRVVNTADLKWTSKKADEDGNPAGDTAQITSNPVYITFPPYKESLPEISITNEIINKKGTYYSGDNIQYQITAENHKVDGKNDSLKSPVISMRMPAMTVLKSSLNGNGYVNGFLITLAGEDGTETVIPASSYKLEAQDTSAPLKDQGNDEYIESSKLKSTQYVFSFDNSIEMKPGDQIKIHYTGIISYEAKDRNGVTDLVCPAYLSSTEKVALSAENPLGLSFIPYSKAGSQELHDNDIIDNSLSDNLQYMNATVTAEVSDSKVVQLVKYIGTENKEGKIDWKGPGEVAQLNPNETYYYKLVLMNNSTEALSGARIADILPYNGDYYVMQAGGSFTLRGTTIPQGEGYEDVSVEKVQTKDGKLSIYSTDYDFAIRRDSEQNKGSVLGMMYDRTDDFMNAGWIQGTGTKPTALGFEMDFSNENLAPYESYEIVFKVKAPGYTADKIQDYYNKVIENSAMASVTRAGTEDNPSYELSDRMEPEKVTAKLALPTGSIGDYVWFDQNNDGIQGTHEEGDEPARNIKVTLYKKTYTLLNGQRYENEAAVDTTTTNQDGWYQFDGLACKYLKEGAAEDSENPADYVGEEYYEYRVQFDITGYTATDQYAGKDRSIDSNIDKNGYTDYITLSVLEGEDGTLSGEQDMTIDAGLVSPYAIGDYVWLDRNNDGIQGADEPGVKDVSVYLYRVGSDGEAEGNYLAKTTTDGNGKYLFKNLIQGQYIVEFDISNLRKGEETHTYQYDFTKAGDQVDNSQSDAKHPVDEDGRIMRTDVITLTKEALAEAAGNPGVGDNQDLRWDAGLVVYSALGGFCFDDQDYNDVHTLNIPLEGTVVTLYEKDGGGIGKEIGTATVGADGKYYFDHLVFPGDEQTYLIRFDYPEGYTGVDSNVGSDDTIDSDALYDSNYWNWEELGLGLRQSGYAEVTLKKDTRDTTWDAGARKYSTIGDYVWEDENKDGRQDEGESPVPGVKVVLQSREGDDGEWKFYAQTATDDNGRYVFTQVKSSEKISTQYRVVFALDAKTKVTACQQPGVSDEENSDAINTYQYDIVTGTSENPITGGYVTRMLKPGYGETDLTWDAGIVRLLSAVGDYTWFDDDYNGVQDEGELPAPNIPVELEYNESGDLENEEAWVKAGETITDEKGKYLFDGLFEGYYRVKFQVPDGYTITKYGQIADLEKDSDAMIRGENRWYTTKSFYLEAGVTDLTWDAGIYKPKVRIKTTTRNEVIPRVIRRTVRRMVKTGDYTPAAALIVVLLVSGGTAGIIISRKKKNKKS